MSEAGTEAGCVPSRGVRVRPAAEADLEAVMRIEAESFANPWTVEDLASCMRRKGAAVLVAVTAGRACGGAEEAVAGSATVAWAGREAEVASLAVARDQWGRGVGSALLAEVVRMMAARKVRWVYLAVRASNAGAVRLYTRMGFAEIGVNPGYYRRPEEDACVLMLDVDAAPVVRSRPPCG